MVTTVVPLATEGNETARALPMLKLKFFVAAARVTRDVGTVEAATETKVFDLSVTPAGVGEGLGEAVGEGEGDGLGEG